MAECVNIVKNRVPVFAGTGSNSTHEAIELSKKADAIGVDGLLVVAPYYNKPSEEGKGLNVVTGKTVDMVKAGIIDPLLVTKSALQNAASVATTILSTDCIINNIRA